MSPFIGKLIDHGVDTETALSRFGDDEQLYERCFYMLLDDPNFDDLGRFIAAADYEAAFNAAHTLKGVVGNLELSALYQSVSAMVESLRTQSCTLLTQQYETIMNEHETLVKLRDR